MGCSAFLGKEKSKLKKVYENFLKKKVEVSEKCESHILVGLCGHTGEEGIRELDACY